MIEEKVHAHWYSTTQRALCASSATSDGNFTETEGDNYTRKVDPHWNAPTLYNFPLHGVETNEHLL